jgi:hypothetical protein
MFEIKWCVVERRLLDGPMEEKILDTFGTGLQEKVCSFTEGSELSPFCRMLSQSNKLYKRVRETSDQAERGISPFRKEQTLHEVSL